MRELKLWCYTQINEATLGLGKENYPYTQMIISSFPGKNPKNYLRQSPGISIIEATIIAHPRK
jgi:hypothetical protein